MKINEERRKMIVAMDYIVRSMNNEDLMQSWLALGVPDGDINHSTDWSTTYSDEYFEEDDNLADLMTLFLRCMKRASREGGLICNGVVSLRRI